MKDTQTLFMQKINVIFIFDMKISVDYDVVIIFLIIFLELMLLGFLRFSTILFSSIFNFFIV